MSIRQLENSFEGERLRRALREQQLVRQNNDLAIALIEVGHRLGFSAGSWLYRTGDTCQGVFFIVHGAIELNRDGNTLARFGAGQQIGSWPVLYSDPTYDVGARAIDDSVVVRVEERHFREVGDRFPVLWENLARTQADRLKQTNEKILPRNPVPRLLIASSTEALSVARKLKSLLIRDCDVRTELWTDVFPAGDSALESLTTGLDDWDFAVFILAPDDEIISRGVSTPAPRDNIIFEAGLCMGRMGRQRALLVSPSAVRDLKIPSDLSGINRLDYVEGPEEVIDKITSTVDKLGPRTRVAVDRL